MGDPNEVRQALFDEIASMARDPRPYVRRPGRDFTRDRKLPLGELLALLVTMGSSSTNHELASFFGYDAAAVPTGSALTQAVAKLADGALGHLMDAMNRRFPPEPGECGLHVVSVDGSEVNVARNPADPSTYHEPTAAYPDGYNSVHAVAAYHVGAMRYMALDVRPNAGKNEYASMCSLVDGWAATPPGETLFEADRGFSSYNVYAHCAERGAYFLIRTTDRRARGILGVGDLPDELDLDARVIVTRSKSWSKRLRQDRHRDYRHVPPNVAFDFAGPGREYEMALRVVRFGLPGGEFENLVTNLPRETFDAGRLKALYRQRWGVETSFRDLKHTLGVKNPHFKGAPAVAAEICARCVLYNCCSAMSGGLPVEPAEGGGRRKHARRANFSMAAAAARAFLRSRGREPPFDYGALAGRYKLPVREGRSFRRRKRASAPASCWYRGA